MCAIVCRDCSRTKICRSTFCRRRFARGRQHHERIDATAKAHDAGADWQIALTTNSRLVDAQDEVVDARLAQYVSLRAT